MVKLEKDTNNKYNKQGKKKKKKEFKMAPKLKSRKFLSDAGCISIDILKFKFPDLGRWCAGFLCKMCGKSKYEGFIRMFHLQLVWHFLPHLVWKQDPLPSSMDGEQC